MKRDFIIHLSFLVAINLLVKPLYIFGIDVGVQNTVGDQYGTFFALINFAYLFQFIADFGVQQYNNRRIAQNSHEINTLFPQLIMTKMLLVVPYMIISFLVAWVLGLTEDWQLLLIVLVNQILVSFTMFIRSNVSGLGMYRKDSILSVLDKLFMIIICGFLLLNPATKSDFSIYTFAIVQTASFLFVLAAGIWMLKGQTVFQNFQWHLNKIKPLLLKSLPFGITVLLMTMYTRIDGVMIKTLLTNGAFEAQVYAGGYRILDAANMFAFLFPPLLLPMFSKLHDQKKALQQLLQMSFSLMWVLVVCASIPCYIYRHEIMDLLYLAADKYWGGVFGILMLNFIWMGLIYIFGTYITAGGRMRQANAIFIICIVLNIVLNAIMIPDYKAWGAAVATLITHGGVVVGLMWIVRVQLLQKSMIKIFALSIVFLASTIAINWAILQLDSVPWMIRFMLSILGSGILSLIIQLVDIRSIRADFASFRRG